jgi:hypothetical protein
MRTLEKTLIVLCVLGLVTKELHWPGGAVFFVAGMSALAAVYFIFGWLLFRDRETKIRRTGLSVAAGIFLAISCVGIMFKLMIWPGSESNIMLGAAGLIAISGITLYKYRDPGAAPELTRFYRNILQRTAPLFVAALGLLFVGENDLIRFHFREDPEFARLLIRARENPENEQCQHELEDYQIQKYEHGNPTN